MIDIEGTITVTVPKRLALSLNQAMNQHRSTTRRKTDQATRKNKPEGLRNTITERASEAAQLAELVKVQIEEVVAEAKDLVRAAKRGGE